MVGVSALRPAPIAVVIRFIFALLFLFLVAYVFAGEAIGTLCFGTVRDADLPIHRER